VGQSSFSDNSEPQKPNKMQGNEASNDCITLSSRGSLAKDGEQEVRSHTPKKMPRDIDG
jgi:hypothetical protein